MDSFKYAVPYRLHFNERTVAVMSLLDELADRYRFRLSPGFIPNFWAIASFRFQAIFQDRIEEVVMKGEVRHVKGFALAAMMQPWVAEAHPFHWVSESIGFGDGLLHPLTSVEHLLTMAAVGLWISRTGKSLGYAMAALFVALLLVGAGLSAVSVEIAYADTIAAASFLALLALLALGGRISALPSAVIVANLAVFHGYVHAYDIWLDTGAVVSTAGFAFGTLILVVVGIHAGRAVKRLQGKTILSAVFPSD